MDEQGIKLNLWGQNYTGQTMSCTPTGNTDTKWGLCAFNARYKKDCSS